MKYASLFLLLSSFFFLGSLFAQSNPTDFNIIPKAKETDKNLQTDITDLGDPTKADFWTQYNNTARKYDSLKDGKKQV